MVAALNTERKQGIEVLGRTEDDALLSVVWPPVRCECGREVAFVVTSGGHARCVDCHAQHLSKEEA